MKKIVSVFLVLALALTLAPAALGADVRPSSQKFTLDGEEVECRAFTIDGYNYVMLRGLASILNGTEKQFSVTWDEAARTVRIATGEPYTPEDAIYNGPAVVLDGNGRVTTAKKSAQTIVIDGRTVRGLPAYAIGGHNYFKLADLQTYLGYGLDYDKSTRTVVISSTVPAVEKTELASAANYGEVLAGLSAAKAAAGTRAGGGGATATAVEDVEMAAAPLSDAAAGTGGEKEADYSGTNVQVEGIDEGDVVKTDGKYLYILRDEKLIIAQAKGADTHTLAVTKVGVSESSDKGGWKSKNPNELYILGDRVAVLSNYYESRETYDGKRWNWKHEEYTAVDIYDVSNPAKPKQVAQLGQDGYTMGSRLKNGTLYLVTNYYVYNYDESDPETYVPRLYFDGKAEATAAGDICIGPSVSSTRYAVVTAYDMASGATTATKSVLGGGSTLYMSHNSIYVADSHYTETASAPRARSVYTVVDYRYDMVTDLYRFDISSGLSVAASGSVPGGLDDQFSMDEYQGNLRLVTTTDGYAYTIYTDKAMGFENYKWGEEVESANGLYILDSGLDITGKVEDLAPGEQVYSARFDGDIAYFCTYRNVDPLFAVDVSDPAEPKILSALKITGFSEYLHPWADGRLFGAGYEADEETGRVGNIKLVMFDTGDKTDVTAKFTQLTDLSYSEAIYNHKAFLISYEHRLIAFPGDQGYCLYGYDDAKGFYQKAVVDLGEWSYKTRGLYIGDMIYVVGSDAVYVLDMGSFAKVAEIPLPV